MKYIVLLTSVFAACAPASNQKQKTLDKFRFPDGVQTKVPQGPNILAVSPGGMLEFNITTNQPANNISHLVTALQIAGGFLENAIKFTNPIKVRVTHGSYCEGECLKDDLNLGYCSANVKDIKDKNIQVAIPYALIHQNQTNREVAADMKMHISDSVDFVNPEDYGSHNHKVSDITETVVHELCHGLGIHSTIDSYIANYSDQSNASKDIEVTAYKHLFDTFIHLRDASGHATTKNSYRKKRSIEISSLEHRKTFYFLTQSKSKINLATGTSSSTPSHFDRDYENTTDFLMATGSVPYGHFLKFQNIRDWKTSPLGPKTIAILETLGYKRNPHPSRAKSQLGFYEKMRPFNKKEGDEQFIPI